MAAALRPITLKEAAERLGVHYMTAYRYVRTGRLPATRDGVQWTVDPADLKAFGARGPRPSEAARSTRRPSGPSRLQARLLAGDEAGAWTIVEELLVDGLDADEVHLDVLVPALRAIGDAWASGDISVAEEHCASAVASRLIGRLGPKFARRGRKRGTVVVGAPPGELHGLPCAIVADLLRGSGFDAVDLGPNTPPESFAGAASRTGRLVAVLVGATTPGRDAAVRSVIRAVRSEGVSAPVLVGGSAIADLDHAERLGADGWTGRDGRSLLAEVERRAAAAEPNRA